MFTQSPIEGAIWTSFVAIQQWIVDNIILSSVFKMSVATWIGFLFIKLVLQMGTSKSPSHAMGKFILALIISASGFSILKAKSNETFRTENSRGQTWDSKQKIKDSSKYSGLFLNTQGLLFYVQIHNGMNQISKYMSGKIGDLFKNEKSNDSPYLLIQTLAQTASQTIDDPKCISGLNYLFENCTDKRKALVLENNSSFSNLFDLSKTECQDKYSEFRKDLISWSRNKYGTSVWNNIEIGTSYLKNKFGFATEEALQNKMIASALVNTARMQLGRGNKQNVNTQALLTNENDPMTASTTTYFTGVSNILSVGGFFNALLAPFTGNDFYGADVRNKSATMYNQILQFLPPIRGYAKGILALAFVFAAASMCFGTLRFMFGWFGLLLMFSLYEPLSTILYETVMLFSNAKETTDAFSALQNDPLILSGAAIIDDNLARIQAVYFALQIGITLACAAGGISLFMHTKRLGSGLSDGLVSKAVSYVALTRSVPVQPQQNISSTKT